MISEDNLKECISAAKVSERKIGVFGYCDRIKE